VSFVAFRDYYLSQEYLRNYLAYGFHLRGDINDDLVVDGADRIILFKAFGTNKWEYPEGTGEDEYNPAADINTGVWDMKTGTATFGDGYINYLDHGKWGMYFGAEP
jgi:hypothetical protein